MDTSSITSQDEKLRCDTVIGHVDNCKLCKVYLRSEIKFLYFIIVILSVIIIFNYIKEHEKHS